MPKRSPSKAFGTLRDHAGRHWITLHCGACNHSKKHDPLDLADSLGLDFPMAQLVDRATCAVCGQRGARLSITPSTRADGSDRPRQLS